MINKNLIVQNKGVDNSYIYTTLIAEGYKSAWIENDFLHF